MYVHAVRSISVTFDVVWVVRFLTYDGYVLLFFINLYRPSVNTQVNISVFSFCTVRHSTFFMYFFNSLTYVHACWKTLVRTVTSADVQLRICAVLRNAHVRDHSWGKSQYGTCIYMHVRTCKNANQHTARLYCNFGNDLLIWYSTTRGRIRLALGRTADGNTSSCRTLCNPSKLQLALVRNHKLYQMPIVHCTYIVRVDNSLYVLICDQIT